MNTGSKLAAYALTLGVALGGGALAGNVVGPIATTGEDPEGHDEPHEAEPAGSTTASTVRTEDEVPTGILASQDGYTLDPEATTFPAGESARFGFRIVGPDGTTVDDFAADHAGELDLVVVGADLRTYARLLPTRADDGTWSVELPTLAPGSYRAFADVAVADGPDVTLGVDVTVHEAEAHTGSDGHG